MEINDEEILARNIFDQGVMVNFSSLPIEHCLYCGIYNPQCLARCEICQYWFCNDSSSENNSGSHIFQHLRISSHKYLSAHRENSMHVGLFRCEECRITNCFNLQIMPNLQILCRRCAQSRRFSNRDLIFSEFIEQQMVNSLKISVPSVEDIMGSLHVTPDQVRRIEENVISRTDPYLGMTEEFKRNVMPHRIKLRYESLNEYYSILSALLEKDMKYNKRLIEGFRANNLVLTMRQNGIGTFIFKSIDYGIRLSNGKYLELKINSVIYNAVVAFIEDREEIIYIKFICRENILNVGEYRFDLSIKFTEIPYQRMFDALFAFKDGYADSTLVNLILGNSLENPEIPLIEEINCNVPGLEPLNPSQQICVRNALSSTYSLIQGPPGTGKTQTLAAIVYYLLENIHPDHKILVCSTSNAAVDNIVKRIAQTGVSVLRICSKLREKITSPVKNHCLHVKLKKYISQMYPEFLSKYISKAIYDEDLSPESYHMYLEYTKNGVENIIFNSKVICCTNVVAGDGRLGNYYYDTVLVDEANQATEPEILIPLLNGCTRFILAGDQMQLGPVSLCSSSVYGGLSRSLFSRLFDLRAVFNVLDTQYRMHPSISRFPIEFFYENRLRNGITHIDRIDTHLRTNFWPNKTPLVFIDHLNFEGCSGAGKSFVNTNEAFLVLECVQTLIYEGVDADRQVILTPYDGQKRYIIELMNIAGIYVEVYNIDEFQGKEKDYVLYSLVRSNERGQVGFLNDFKRMNVGITRAKYGMVIFGSSSVLINSRLWRHFIKDYSENNLIFEGMFGNLRQKHVQVGELEVYDFSHVFPYAGNN
ncbi:hypothetical protein SteCoe_8886 [Stentor coeruleus]|uniref:Upf1 domain-containing protein n=1 Tax=Stentor coeruleus TaxID=5963 RepID=A0A1R2CJD0_9CILI|nr:hypothetical protein SteCoe_8886 [Stentor coeruleus]